jgi:hypothetical protein
MFSTLNNNFIDDFHNIYELNDNNDFIINLDIITKWLDSKKGKLKETLIRTYNKNIDYIITKEKSGKISKSNKEIIMLTPDSFTAGTILIALRWFKSSLRLILIIKILYFYSIFISLFMKNCARGPNDAAHNSQFNLMTCKSNIIPIL